MAVEPLAATRDFRAPGALLDALHGEPQLEMVAPQRANSDTVLLLTGDGPLFLTPQPAS